MDNRSYLGKLYQEFEGVSRGALSQEIGLGVLTKPMVVGIIVKENNTAEPTVVAENKEVSR